MWATTTYGPSLVTGLLESGIFGMGFRASVGASTRAIIGDWALGIWDFRDVKDAMVGLKPYHANFITAHV